MHTSTVTVAVLPQGKAAEGSLPDQEIETRITKEGGPGGQHANKTLSTVVLRHTPTGIEAKASGERSQHRNRQLAREVLEARVHEHRTRQEEQRHNALRRTQVGSGMRGDKFRTYRVRDDRVVDARTGRAAPLQRVLRGELEALDTQGPSPVGAAR